MRRALLTGGAASLMVVGALAPTAAAQTEGEGCSPDRRNVPVCPFDADLESASFLDPTALVLGARAVSVGESVYVGPFAELIADEHSPVSIGAESNVQDNVVVAGSHELRDEHTGGDTVVEGGPQPTAAPGVEIGERVILAHGSSVIGPAQIGVTGGDIAADPDDDQEVFLSFGSRVDGGVLEKNTGISALGRVGPGVTLRSGFLVLPGKDVTTQAEADDPALGKVRLINEADVAFNEAVLQVNIEFARTYTELYREDPGAVRGVNVDPGGTEFNATRDLPSFDGRERAVPGARNRIIGDVDLADSYGRFNRVSGEDVSLRADEGETMDVGRIDSMGDEVVFHALEDTDLVVGDDVTYGDGAIVHGGGRVILAGDPEEPTVVEDDVTFGDEAIAFRSTIGAGSTIGERSIVVGTDLAPGTEVPPFTVVINGEVFGQVEW